MIRRPPISTRTDTLFPYTTLFRSEVSDALVQLNKLEEQIDRAQSRKNILEKAIPNARLLFNSGMATYLEVITAQQNALQNELSLTGLKRRQVNAYILLYRSLGVAYIGSGRHRTNKTEERRVGKECV